MSIKMDSIIKILEYTNIIHSISLMNKSEHYLNCQHTFESELITNGPYREYEYVCSKCRYATNHIV